MCEVSCSDVGEGDFMQIFGFLKVRVGINVEFIEGFELNELVPAPFVKLFAEGQAEELEQRVRNGEAWNLLMEGWEISRYQGLTGF